MCPVAVCPLPLSAMCEVHLCHVVTDCPFLSLHGSRMTEHFQWTWGLSPVLVTVNSAAVTIPVPLSGRVSASLVWRCWLRGFHMLSFSIHSLTVFQSG